MAQLKTLIVNGSSRLNGPLYLTNDAVGLKTLSNLYTASSRPTNANIATTANGSGGLSTFKATSGMTANKPPIGDSHIIHLYWDNNGGYDAQLAVGYAGDLCVRGQSGGTWNGWKTVPNVYTGTAAPDASLGKNGDIYIVAN
jgi:hypothetical protein